MAFCWAYFWEGLFSKVGVGGGGYFWRDFCTSKMVQLIFGRDFAGENDGFFV